jgi:hypothetical protein
MAMVWAEIVVHKDVDWRTVYGRNVSHLNRDLWMIPTKWIGPSDCWPRWSNRISNNGSYGAPTITGPHKHLSHGEEYNPYRTVANDPPQTFSTAHEGGSHGYDYNPYHSVGNDPPATFSVPHGGPSHGYDYSPYHTAGSDPHPSFGMAHEGRSYGYDHGPHNTAFDIPPPTFGSAHEQPSHCSVLLTTIRIIVSRTILLQLSAHT